MEIVRIITIIVSLIAAIGLPIMVIYKTSDKQIMKRYEKWK
jgi:hypothetical protein